MSLSIVKQGGCSVTVLYDRMPEIAAKLPELADDVVRKTAFDIMADSQSRVHVKTGACKNSHYVVTSQGSGQGQALSDALSVNPRVKFAQMQPGAVGKCQAVVCVGVSYGTSLELRYPYLIPAFEAQMPAYRAALDSLVSRL